MHKQPEGGGFGIADMRHWDMALLERYKPAYHAVNSSCSLCGLGPCDLNNSRKGACGQDQITFLAREALLIAVTGAAAHASHARDVVERLISRHGNGLPIDLGQWINIKMPIARIITGTHPETIADLPPILDYIDSQIVRLLASAHFGGESSHLDYESKTLHAGTMDILSMEIADVAQISGYSFPKGDAGSDFLSVGAKALSSEKPLILCIGHHSDVGHCIIEKIESGGMSDDIGVAGLCCTGHDMARGQSSKRGSAGDVKGVIIAGNLRDQLRFVRTGRADVIVVDQQCVRLDLLSEAEKAGAFFIATSDQSCSGLPDETRKDPLEVASGLISRGERAVFISDPDKAALLAIALARAVSRGKEKEGIFEKGINIRQRAKDCNNCGLCSRHCPVHLPVSGAIFSLREEMRNIAAARGTADLQSSKNLRELNERCIGCGRCDSACPRHIPVMSILGLYDDVIRERSRMRTGRGPIDDYEIKGTGPSIILGDIPGVVAFLTCPDYPDERGSVSRMARVLAERGYIVLAAGCAAMDIAVCDDAAYSDFPCAFDTGSIINTGSCVSSSHAIGALIKVASIFLHRRLDGNYEEIADYILNRIGAVGVMWGGITPKSFSASAGANRLGIPVVFGRQGYKFRRTLEGGKGHLFDARSGRKIASRLAPESLFAVSDRWQDAIVRIAKLCIRPNDTAKGRQTKLRNYIELSEALLGETPSDIADYVRVYEDLPQERHEELAQALSKGNWQPGFIPDPTLLERLIHHEIRHI